MQQYKKIKEESEVESSRTSLASKVKSLTSKPPSPRKYPVLGRGQHYFLICWKSAKVMNIFSLTKISRKNCDFLREDVFFLGKHLRVVSLALSIPVLGLEKVCPRKVGNWSWAQIFFCVLGLEPRVLDSTSTRKHFNKQTEIELPPAAALQFHSIRHDSRVRLINMKL